MFRGLIPALALVLPLVLAPTDRTLAAGRKARLGLAIHSTANEYWNQQAEGGRLFAASLPPGLM